MKYILINLFLFITILSSFIIWRSILYNTLPYHNADENIGVEKYHLDNGEIIVLEGDIIRSVESVNEINEYFRLKGNIIFNDNIITREEYIKNYKIDKKKFLNNFINKHKTINEKKDNNLGKNINDKVINLYNNIIPNSYIEDYYAEYYSFEENSIRKGFNDEKLGMATNKYSDYLNKKYGFEYEPELNSNLNDLYENKKYSFLGKDIKISISGDILDNYLKEKKELIDKANINKDFNNNFIKLYKKYSDELRKKYNITLGEEYKIDDIIFLKQFNN